MQSSQEIYKYKPVKENCDDIQIIFDDPDVKGAIGHWRSIYYNYSTSKLYVYDSLNTGSLRSKMIQCIKKLYPLLNTQNGIIFKRVLSTQSDLISCGVYAAAFAVTLAIGGDPSTEDYFVDENQTDRTIPMRKHLWEILETKFLSVFPTKEVASRPTKETITLSESDKDFTDEETEYNNSLPKGFSNNKGVEYYANSVFQVLLTKNNLRQELLNCTVEPVKNLVKSYADSSVTVLSPTPVRMFMERDFEKDEQQDTEHFFLYLNEILNIGKETTTIIGNSFEILYTTEKSCRNNECIDQLHRCETNPLYSSIRYILISRP